MVSMLTTIDNPYSPFDEFDKWYNYDVLKGHNCCAILERFAHTADELPENLNEIELNRAIDEICEFDVMGIYMKVTKND